MGLKVIKLSVSSAFKNLEIINETYEVPWTQAEGGLLHHR